VFVFEAFGAAHRPHSSINGIKIPIRVAGLLMQKELEIFSQVLGAPKRPCLAILGGAKISDKILVIENLLDLVDEMIIGGGMAYTFKKLVDGVEIGGSLFDKPGSEHVARIMEKARKKNVKLHFPIDHVIADKFSSEARTGVTDDKAGVPQGWMALDIGPQSRSQFSRVCEGAQTILWNGPMGVFEKGPFAAGTLSVMCDCCIATKRGATVIIGGGDTGAASNSFYYHDKSCAEQVTHVSTGGGSSLVLMEGKMLPGVQGLTNATDLPAGGAGAGSAGASAGSSQSTAKPEKDKLERKSGKN
jgi:phosphoglycerate kinase